MHKHYEMIENEKLRTQTTGKMTVWNFFLLRDVCMAMSNSFISIVRDMFNRKIIFSPLKQHFVEYDFVFFSPCLFYPCPEKKEFCRRNANLIMRKITLFPMQLVPPLA